MSSVPWGQNQPDSNLQLSIVWIRKLTPRKRVTQPRGHRAFTLKRTDLSQAPSPPPVGSDQGRSRHPLQLHPQRNFCPRRTQSPERSRCLPRTTQLHLADHDATALCREISRKTFWLIKKTIDCSLRETNRPFVSQQDPDSLREIVRSKSAWRPQAEYKSKLEFNHL